MKNTFREHVRLSGIEIKRIVNRKQFLLAGAVILWLVYHDVLADPPRGQPPGLYGIIAITEGNLTNDSFIAALGGASALAVDNETGFLGLTLSRNIARSHHILHKIAAMWSVVAAVTIVRHLLVYAVGAFVFPWDVPALGECLQYVHDARGWPSCIEATPNTLDEALGPFPALFLTHPVLNDIVGVVMVLAGTGVMALLGFLAAACGANTFLAMATPVIVTFSFQVMLTDIVPCWADPTRFADVFWGDYRVTANRADRHWIWLVSWLVWTGLLTGLTIYIAEKRELATKGGDL